MASSISATNRIHLSPLSIKGMSHDRLLIKLKEVTDDNLKLLKICQQRDCEIKCLKFRMKSMEDRFMNSSLHPGIKNIKKNVRTARYFTFGDIRE